MNLTPLVSSNFWAARTRPTLPSQIKSGRLMPRFWYFLATETTNRRFERTSFSSASWSPSRMRPARAGEARPLEPAVRRFGGQEIPESGHEPAGLDLRGQRGSCAGELL